MPGEHDWPTLVKTVRTVLSEAFNKILFQIKIEYTFNEIYYIK